MTESPPSSRGEAAARGEARYLTGISCRRGHTSERRTDNGGCVDCIRLSKTPEYNREQVKRWRAANPERQKAKAKSRYWANPSAQRDHVRRWAKENPHKIWAKGARRRANELMACPSWVDLRAIDLVYLEAKRLSKETCITYQVDHIVPLAGDNVCGLHVSWNLRPLPAIENISKGYSFDEKLAIAYK